MAVNAPPLNVTFHRKYSAPTFSSCTDHIELIRKYVCIIGRAVNWNYNKFIIEEDGQVKVPSVAGFNPVQVGRFAKSHFWLTIPTDYNGNACLGKFFMSEKHSLMTILLNAYRGTIDSTFAQPSVWPPDHIIKASALKLYDTLGHKLIDTDKLSTPEIQEHTFKPHSALSHVIDATDKESYMAYAKTDNGKIYAGVQLKKKLNNKLEFVMHPAGNENGWQTRLRDIALGWSL